MAATRNHSRPFGEPCQAIMIAIAVKAEITAPRISLGDAAALWSSMLLLREASMRVHYSLARGAYKCCLQHPSC